MINFLTVEDSLQLAAGFFNFEHLDFDIFWRRLHFVSNFDIRISNFLEPVYLASKAMAVSG